MKLHRYVDHQRLHIVTKDVISLSISVLLLFRHYISHKITFGAPSSGGVLCSACGAFITGWDACSGWSLILSLKVIAQDSKYFYQLSTWSKILNSSWFTLSKKSLNLVVQA